MKNITNFNVSDIEKPNLLHQTSQRGIEIAKAFQHPVHAENLQSLSNDSYKTVWMHSTHLNIIYLHMQYGRKYHDLSYFILFAFSSLFASTSKSLLSNFSK